MKWIFSGTSTWNPDSSKLIKKIDYVYSSSTEGMAWKDLMTKYDGKTITYDAIGNPTSYMGSTMYWEGRNLVEQIKNGTTITYSYDSSDMRTSKTVGGVKHNYYYVEGKLMYEDCPSYKLFYTYDANGFLSGIKRVKSNGTTEDFGVHCNIFGDVIAIYEQGVLIAKYSYDTWGKLISVTESNGLDIMGDNDIWTQNSIRYRGYVYDEETGLYYLQSRYYDATTGRFINADDYSVLTASPTALTDKNLFAYCDSNPIIRADDEGDVWHLVIGAGVGVATQFVSDVGIGLLTGSSLKEIIGSLSPVDYASAAIGGAIAASGIGAVGAVVANAALGGTTYLANCSYKGTEANTIDFVAATVIGGVSGAIGGPGANGKNMRGVYSRSKQVINATNSTRKLAMYNAKITAVKKNVVVSGVRTFVAGVFSNVSNFFRKLITGSQT